MAPIVLAAGQSCSGQCVTSRFLIGTGPHKGNCRRCDRISLTSLRGVVVGLVLGRRERSSTLWSCLYRLTHLYPVWREMPNSWHSVVRETSWLIQATKNCCRCCIGQVSLQGISTGCAVSDVSGLISQRSTRSVPPGFDSENIGAN